MHTCHATGCKAKVPQVMFTCPKHWRRLPEGLRDRIWNTYREGQCNDWRISHAYANAAREAVTYLAIMDGVKPDTSVYDMLDPEKPKRRVPAMTGKSNLFDNEMRQVFMENRGVEVPIQAGGDLPEGINGGVLKVTKIKLDTYSSEAALKGEPYFFVYGVVVRPLEHNGVTTEGMQTRVIDEPLCNTPTRTRKTKKEHILFMTGVLQQLAGMSALKNLDPALVEDGSFFQAVLKANPYCRFHTWKGSTPTEGKYKGQAPRVQVQFDGVCKFSEDGVPGGGMVDNTETTKQSAPELAAPNSEVDDNIPFDELATKADKPEEDAIAQRRLMDAAEARGYSREEVEDESLSWQQVADMAKNPKGSSPESSSVSNDPSEGEQPFYKPPRAKQRKLCKITSVNKDIQTAHITNKETGQNYLDVPWSKLEWE